MARADTGQSSHGWADNSRAFDSTAVQASHGLAGKALYVCMYVCMYVCVYCTYMYVCMYVCMHTVMCKGVCIITQFIVSVISSDIVN